MVYVRYWGRMQGIIIAVIIAIRRIAVSERFMFSIIFKLRYRAMRKMIMWTYE